MEAVLALAVPRWIYFAALALLLGASLFPVYAPAKRPKGVALDRPRGDSAEAMGRALVGRASVGEVLIAVAAIAAAVWFAALSHGLDATQPLPRTMRLVLFHTSFGPSWIARFALLALAGLCAAARRPGWVLAAAVGLAICEGWDGHALAHGPWGEAAQAAHVLAGSAWVGGLFALAQRLSSDLRAGRPAEAAFALRRFSTIGSIAVLCVLVSGVANLVLLGQGVRLNGPYAFVAAVKITLVVAMIGLACVNRFYLMPRIEAPTPGGETDTRRAVVAVLRLTMLEQGLGICVLLAVATLGLLDPYMSWM